MVARPRTGEAVFALEPRAAAQARAHGGVLDAAGFRRLYEQTHARLRAYVHRVAGSAGRTDDIVQEAYLRLLEAPPRVHDGRPLAPYLFRIATNLARDHWRWEARSARLRAALPAPARPGPTPEGRHDLEDKFSRLRPRERALLWLAHVEGRSHREIAVILELRPLSVRVLLSRARRRLLSLLEEST